MVAIVVEYEQLSEGHVRWFTHKNPYGCWICDVFSLLRKVIEEIEIEERSYVEKEELDSYLPSPQASESIKDEEQSES